MIQESYRGYFLNPEPFKTRRERWNVAVTVYRETDSGKIERTFMAEDGIEYILELEAAKEGCNLGRNLIDKGLVGF